MFDISYFRKDPRPFFKFAREIYPGQFRPSPCHRFIRTLERHGKLLRNYTQNIDTLEQVVGIERVVQCHGSFATATCTKCKRKVDAEAIREHIFEQRIPYCEVCVEQVEAYKRLQEMETPPIAETTTTAARDAAEEGQSSGCSESQRESSAEEREGEQQQKDSSSNNQEESGAESESDRPATVDPMLQPGIMKPDIVFFGESLGDAFHESVGRDKGDTDLLIMIGSSLKVRPVALIPSSVPPDVPQVLINREPLPHLTPDVELLGDCDGIVDQICRILGEGWEEPVHREDGPLAETRELMEKEEDKSWREWEEKVAAARIKKEEAAKEAAEKAAAKESSEQQQGDAAAAADVPAQEGGSAENGAEDDGDNDDVASTPFWLHARQSLASRLPPSTYFFRPPNRYVFPGAEVYSDDEEDSDSGSSSGDSSDDESSSKDEEERKQKQQQEEEKAQDGGETTTAAAPSEQSEEEKRQQEA